MSARRVVELLRSPRDAWLVLRMTAWAVVLPLLKFVLPLPRLVRLLSNGWARPRDPDRERRVSELATLIYRAQRPGFGDNCLERSLVTYRYLGRLGAEPSLTVAVGKESGDVIGHVWVSVDGTPVQDAPDLLARYVPVVTFDPRGNATKL
jgi:hypothetical protein